MKERPILFSAPMVRALLTGTKTQTRRVAKEFCPEHVGILPGFPNQSNSPYGQPGDLLWVRETWQELYDPNSQRTNCHEQTTPPTPHHVIYRATDERPEGATCCWRPSIYMRRWMSRITLEIVSVRVELLQDISEADATAEGLEVRRTIAGPFYPDYGWKLKDGSRHDYSNPRESYRTLWESINGPGSWAKNPWVWVIEFKKR